MTCRRKIVAALITVLACVASQAASVEEQLMQADRDFASSAAERGIDGWRVILDTGTADPDETEP